MIVLVVIVLEVNIEVTVVVIAKTSVPVTIQANSDPGGDNGCSGVGNSGIGGDGDVSLQSQKTFTSPASGNHPYTDPFGFLPSLSPPPFPLAFPYLTSISPSLPCPIHRRTSSMPPPLFLPPHFVHPSSAYQRLINTSLPVKLPVTLAPPRRPEI